MKRYENIEHKMCEELDKLDKELATRNGDMTLQELEMVRLIYSTLKSREMYFGMVGEDDDDMDGSGDGMMPHGERSYYGRGGRSYRRGRDSRGRYISMDMGMPDGYSGHYPDWMPNYYPRY